jgi:hypothetical protein
LLHVSWKGHACKGRLVILRIHSVGVSGKPLVDLNAIAVVLGRRHHVHHVLGLLLVH